MIKKLIIENVGSLYIIDARNKTNKSQKNLLDLSDCELILCLPYDDHEVSKIKQNVK